MNKNILIIDLLDLTKTESILSEIIPDTTSENSSLGISIRYKIGGIKQITMIEDAILLFTFEHGELRFNCSINDLKTIQNENGETFDPSVSSLEE